MCIRDSFGTILNPAAEPADDRDPTPATLAWGQDTVAPVVFVNPMTRDPETPQQPVVLDRSLGVRLNSNEPDAGFECELDGAATACPVAGGALTGLRSGDHSFRARAVDRAGNVSAWSAAASFTVPKDLRARRGWTTRSRAGAFDRSVVTTRRRGARLVIRTAAVGELRLYAATSPRAGVVRVRVGRTRWRRVDLSGPRKAQQEFVVIDRYQGTRKGKVEIRVVSRGKPVTLDAVVARRNVFGN